MANALPKHFANVADVTMALCTTLLRPAHTMAAAMPPQQQLATWHVQWATRCTQSKATNTYQQSFPIFSKVHTHALPYVYTCINIVFFFHLNIFVSLYIKVKICMPAILCVHVCDYVCVCVCVVSLLACRAYHSCNIVHSLLAAGPVRLVHSPGPPPCLACLPSVCRPSSPHRRIATAAWLSASFVIFVEFAICFFFLFCFFDFVYKY